MSLIGPLALPDDVKVVRVADLGDDVRATFEHEPDDHVVTRRSVRTASIVVDPDTAALLEHFRTPATVAHAVLAFATSRGRSAREVLDGAYPVLRKLLDARVLVRANEREEAGLSPGDRIGEWEVVSIAARLEDTEVAMARAEGMFAAVKIATKRAAARMREVLDREAKVVEHLDGRAGPRLAGSGDAGGRPYIAMDWIDGAVSSQAFAELVDAGDRAGALALARAVAEAYAALHERGVVHGDVHPGNVLVSAEGRVALIDFGHARAPCLEIDGVPRAGVGFYFEPEYAAAVSSGRTEPQASEAGEQHAVAALLYRMLVGSHHVDFSLEPKRVLHQIADEPPLSFGAQRVQPWPELERVLVRALAKAPEDRFASMRAFADALASVPAPPAPSIHAARRASLDARLADVLARLAPGGALDRTGFEPPRSSVNLGASGAAYALYRIACARDDASLLSRAREWIDRARREGGAPDGYANAAMDLDAATVGEISAHHARPGAECVDALIALARGDLESARRASSRFLSAIRAPSREHDVAFGRAGALIASSLLVEAGAPIDLVPAGRDLDAALSHQLAGTSIERGSKLTNLGVAHGWAGVLYASLRWSRATGEPFRAGAVDRLDRLIALARPSGRGLALPIALDPGAEEREMPGWCGGAAGFVHLALVAHEVLREPRFLEVAERFGLSAWDAGDGSGDLCCGLAGRAYALLALHRRTESAVWIRRAQQLAVRAAAAIQRGPLRRDSLYRGDLGVAVLAADLERPAFAAMPFFEAEGWPRPRGLTSPPADVARAASAGTSG